MARCTLNSLGVGIVAPNIRLLSVVRVFTVEAFRSLLYSLCVLLSSYRLVDSMDICQGAVGKGLALGFMGLGIEFSQFEANI